MSENNEADKEDSSSPDESNAKDGKQPNQERNKEPERGIPPGPSQSMKLIFDWAMTEIFDFNPAYFLQMRGIMNIIHLVLALVTVSLLSSACKFTSYIGGGHRENDDYACMPAETYLFVVAVSSFLTSTLYFLCCLLSKRTCAILYETAFEVSYFVLYVGLYLTASATLAVSIRKMEENCETCKVAMFVGFANMVAYGISTVVFFLCHTQDPKAPMPA